jgi:chromosome segregation ATPase
VSPRSEGPASTSADRAERIARAKVAVAQAKAELEAQRAVAAVCEERVGELEKALDAANAEARMARRKLGDCEEKLERAEKRVRVLET